MALDVMNGATGALNGEQPTPEPPAVPETTKTKE